MSDIWVCYSPKFNKLLTAIPIAWDGKDKIGKYFECDSFGKVYFICPL